MNENTMSEETAAAIPDMSHFSDTRLRTMLGAGEEVLETFRVLGKAGNNVVGQVIKHHGTFYKDDHYPPGDIYDRETCSQYYYHAHRPETGEHGHFHLFLRSGAIPDDMVPMENPASDDSLRPLGDDAISHIVAISMDKAGIPQAFFTTNRWVTAETLYRADDVISLADRFAIDHAEPCWATNRWLTAMLRLFRPQVEQLLHQRDAALEAWHAAHPDRDLFEDRELEVTSEIAIDIDTQMAALDAEVERRGLDVA